jgi:RimJ/RimL family protein N-acetyltransferase
VLWRSGPAGLTCRVGGEHTLPTARLVLTVARWSDQILALQLARDEQAQHWLGWSPETYAGQADLIRPSDPLLLGTDGLVFVARDRITGRLVVDISLIPRPLGEYDIGGKVDPDLRGQGYGTEAMLAACDLAHRHFGIMHLRAGCETTNEASRRWLVRCGFVPTAGPARHTLPNGRVIDSLWWAHVDPAAKVRCRSFA